MELQQADNKYLVYKSQIEQSVDEKRPILHSGDLLCLWSERLVLVEDEHTGKFWNFQAIDIMTNESRSISFPKSDSQFDEIQVFPLVKNYGFIIEKLNGHPCIINLVKIHWKTSEIQVFEQFERQWNDEMNILVDKMQPSKFVLKTDRTYEVCKLNGGKIEFCDVHTTDDFGHYFNDKLFVFDRNEENFVIRIYDLLLKKTQSFQIEELAGYDISKWSAEWVKNRVYAVAGSCDEKKFDIAWADSETKRLTLLDLTTTVFILKLSFLNGNLLAFAKESNKQNGIITSTVEVHSVPMRRPHSLRQMAWLIVVQQMKNSGEIDPYKEAARYLPLTTDLRAPWFTDEVKDEATGSQENLDAKEDESSQDEVQPKRYKPN